MKSGKKATKRRSDDMPDDKQLLHLYRQMVLLRECELAVQKEYRAGKLPGFVHLYIGEEAVAVGLCAHLRKDDWITSTHRGHGHVLAKGVPPKDVLAELAGKAAGCSGGRGGSMHMYNPENGLFGTNGIVGGGIPLAVGLGISAQVRKTDQVAVCFFGDGAVNYSAFHEAINLAGIRDAPVVFVCENNRYATCTPFHETTRNSDVASKAAAYGIPGVAVDGNDVLAVWRVGREAVARARSGNGPTLIEAHTYRQMGHHEGDVMFGTYRTEEEVNAWIKRCPILKFRNYLLTSGNVTKRRLDSIDKRTGKQMAEAMAFAISAPEPDPATTRDNVYANPINPPMPEPESAPPAMEDQGWLDAVRDGIAEEMRRDPNIIYLGEGIGERGGSWGHTKNLFQEFGPHRMIDTPISELGFTGAAIAASATGCRAISDLMVSDLLFDAGSQIVHQAAKLRYMSNGQINVPVIIRSGAGTIKNTGPQHSAMYHPVWAHIPGLIVVLPSNPADAKGLIKTALRAGDPVIFHEHKTLFSSKGPVPVGEHMVPFGEACVVREGRDLTIVSCGLMVRHSLEASDVLASEGISCEVIDLRTIVPLDVETLIASVAKTMRLLVVDEGFPMCGLGGEIAAVMMEQAFDYLDAPVGRLHTDSVIHPFAPALENQVLVNPEGIVAAARAVLEGKPLVPWRVTGGRILRSVPAAPSPLPTPAAGGRQHMASAAHAVVPDSDRVPPVPAVAASPACTGNGTPLLVPNMDLTVAEVTIARWIRKVGDTVKSGEAVVEVETDKAVVEVESPADGVLTEVVAVEGMTVALGERIGTIRAE